MQDIDKQEQINIEKEARLVHERRVREYQRRTFGERYVGASLAKIQTDSGVLERISGFLRSPRNILVYCGSPGIGKTYFCAALTDWMMTKFDWFRYWNESEIFKRLRHCMNEYDGDYLDHLKRLIDDQFVIIDDIGSTGYTQWREEVLFDAIDERYNTMLPTVLTSNLCQAEFKKIYHPRVVDRIFSKENTIIEISDGISLRTQGL